MELSEFLLQMVSGLQRGSIFVLIALGLTMIFGTLGVVNFAHGALYMVGAYLGYVIIQEAGHWAAFIGVPVLLFVLGIALERGLIRYFYRRPVTDQILVTFGLALVIQELMRWIFGGTNLPYQLPTWAAIPMDIGIGFYPPWRLLIIGVTAAVVLALFLMFRYTRFGLVVRAGMRDPEMLKLLGVNVTQRFALVFGIGALLAGIAGVMGASTTGLTPEVGMHVLVPSFLVVVIGGMGSIPGAVLAGLLLGIAQSFTIMIYPPLTDVILYVVAAVVLLVRPRGLLGLKGVAE